MQFLKTAAWVVVAVVLALFWTYNRDITVPVNLFDQVVMEVKAPALILGSFLLGLIPMWLYHRASKWQLNRRIEGSERALAASASHLLRLQVASASTRFSIASSGMRACGMK